MDTIEMIKKGIPLLEALKTAKNDDEKAKIMAKYKNYHWMFGKKHEDIKREAIKRIEPSFSGNILYVKWYGKKVPYSSIANEIIKVMGNLGINLTHEEVYVWANKKETNHAHNGEWQMKTTENVMTSKNMTRNEAARYLRSLGYEQKYVRIAGKKRLVWLKQTEKNEQRI